MTIRIDVNPDRWAWDGKRQGTFLVVYRSRVTKKMLGVPFGLDEQRFGPLGECFWEATQ